LKPLEHTLKTYVYNHYNMCNIPIYFCNIDVQHLQHTSETTETPETYSCNMCFQRSIYLLLGRMDARGCGARHGAELNASEWRGEGVMPAVNDYAVLRSTVRTPTSCYMASDDRAGRCGPPRWRWQHRAIGLPMESVPCARKMSGGWAARCKVQIG
jgi:hypothetical protein